MRTRSRLLAGMALALGLATLSTPGTASPAVERTAEQVRAARTDPPPQLQRRGRWLVDPQGRVVIVHGVNLVWKRAPYAPPATAAGFTAADAQWLKRHGFNGVRLGTLWAGLTPDQPGQADPTYRARWQRVMDLLSERGIWMQLDMHQDQWHETYGGEGVPDWAMVRPAPYDLLPPVNAPFPLGYWTPEVSTVFDNFWADKGDLLTGWVKAWRVAARWWRDQPYSMGYDLINEPWMGLEGVTVCLTVGCPGSYANELVPAYRRATRAIRDVDPRGIVWWEPQQLAAGRQVPLFLEAMAGERQLGLSWHNYCFSVFLESQGIPGTNVEDCWEFSRERTRTAAEQAREMRATAIMSEWGATDNVRAIEIDAAVADEHLMGWLHWAYKRWNDPTTADTAQGLFHDDADLSTVKKDKVAKLVRTYAQRTAGRPLRMRFDAVTGDFWFRYRPDRRIQAPTVIFVSPLHYEDGYRVRVRGGEAVRRRGGLVWVKPNPGRQRPVTVRVLDR